MNEHRSIIENDCRKMIQIQDCSPQARKKILTEDRGERDEPNLHHRAKYPFERMFIGECFTVPSVGTSEPSLRVTASRVGAKLKRKFTVILHPEFQCIEVARIA